MGRVFIIQKIEDFIGGWIGGIESGNNDGGSEVGAEGGGGLYRAEVLHDFVLGAHCFFFFAGVEAVGFEAECAELVDGGGAAGGAAGGGGGLVDDDGAGGEEGAYSREGGEESDGKFHLTAQAYEIN